MAAILVVALIVGGMSFTLSHLTHPAGSASAPTSTRAPAATGTSQSGVTSPLLYTLDNAASCSRLVSFVGFDWL